ncbi:MAG: hypothetical protein QOG63_2606 [Thermoleophilaceae bacterium]|jgi:hypothetical protein|nr:hypothetical protein [Thermoleophilaceae bacterium]
MRFSPIPPVDQLGPDPEPYGSRFELLLAESGRVEPKPELRPEGSE